jgi:sugar/nucleoside kinase (ribokinase family)
LASQLPEPRLPALRPDPGEVDVLVVGKYFCDLVYSGLQGLPLIGEEIWADACSVVPGGTYITAAALHRLGVSLAWSTRFGSDPFSRFVLDSARNEGLDETAFTVVDRPLRNISVALSFGAERSFVSYADPDDDDNTEAIERLRPRILVRPGMGRVEETAELAAAAHAIGAIVFLDSQSTTKTIDDAGVRELLEVVDVFAPNEHEALMLTGATDVDAALEALTRSTSLVLLKMGERGAMAADHHGSRHSPAVATRVLDTTGAGDCFNAGFLMAMLDGGDMATCLRAGNVAGSLSTRAPSSQGVPTRAEVLAGLLEAGGAI